MNHFMHKKQQQQNSAQRAARNQEKRFIFKIHRLEIE